MVNKLFILSIFTLTFVGCESPSKGPSPVTDGNGDANLLPATGLTPIAVPVVEPPPLFIEPVATPKDVTPVAPPKPAPAPKAPSKSIPKKPTKSKDKLPLNSNSSK